MLSDDNIDLSTPLIETEVDFLGPVETQAIVRIRVRGQADKWRPPDMLP